MTFTPHAPAHYFSSDSHRLPKAREPYGTIRDPCALASQCVSVLERESSRGSRCQQAGWFKFNRNRADICMAGPVSPLLLSLLTHRHTQSVFIVTSHRHHHTHSSSSSSSSLSGDAPLPPLPPLLLSHSSDHLDCTRGQLRTRQQQ